jgi:hypothetical protein
MKLFIVVYPYQWINFSVIDGKLHLEKARGMVVGSPF